MNHPLSEIASRGECKSSPLTAYLDSIRRSVKSASPESARATRIEVDVALNSVGDPTKQSEFVAGSVKVCMVL